MTEPDPIPLYWYAKKENFGDLLGPWMIRKLTGRDVVNVRGSDAPDAVGLATVGSLIHSLDRPGLSIWGSGSISELTPRQVATLKTRRPAAIHAVRGALTRDEIRTKLGWDVPAILGDPALLLPDVYTPRPRPALQDKIALVPHYAHRKHFAKINSDALHVVDVRDKPGHVIDRIAGAACCISTSLHGLIVAQAYGIPWVWLRLTDTPLLGGDFKFEDFFTVLKRDAVRIATLDPAAVSPARLRALAGFAFLPALQIPLAPLRDSFPYRRNDTQAPFSTGTPASGSPRSPAKP